MDTKVIISAVVGILVGALITFLIMHFTEKKSPTVVLVPSVIQPKLESYSSCSPTKEPYGGDIGCVQCKQTDSAGFKGFFKDLVFDSIVSFPRAELNDQLTDLKNKTTGKIIIGLSSSNDRQTIMLHRNFNKNMSDNRMANPCVEDQYTTIIFDGKILNIGLNGTIAAYIMDMTEK